MTTDVMQRDSLGRFISRYAPLVACLAFISLASSEGFSAENTSRLVGPVVQWFFPNISGAHIALIHYLVRKLAHFTEYAVLGTLAARAFRTSPRPNIRKHWLLIAIALIVCYALLDEYHQSFVPDRTASIRDSFIDMSGGIAALFVVYWRKAWKHSSN